MNSWTDKRVLLLLIPAVCALTQVLRENYPFSHYPMYSNPGPGSGFYHLADGDGQALPINSLTGKTAPKLGKMLGTYAKLRGEKMKLSRDSELQQADWDAVCQETLDYLRQQAVVRQMELPAKLQIIKTEISYADGKVVEIPRVFYAE